MATMNSGLGGPAGYGENVFSTSDQDRRQQRRRLGLCRYLLGLRRRGLDFFGTTYTGLYVNSNGNISFGSAFTDYQTADLSAETTPLIAPFFGDVNINAGGEIYWDLDADRRHGHHHLGRRRALHRHAATTRSRSC